METVNSANSVTAISNLLLRGEIPVTSNREALIELGFEPAYPQIRQGYEATVWERAVGLDRRSSGGARLLARERAILRV